jgi:two-component system cell cycle response regulator DivK
MKKILIVEDDPKSLYLARFLLANAGFAIVEATDGQEAVAKAGEEMPDLILMDMQLPIIDGYEATRRIKSNESLAHISIVALTAYAMKGDKEKTQAAGCTGYIEKPVDPPTFVDEVKRYLL